MTHMWKCEETYYFDMPGPRINDVYVKNSRHPLRGYLKATNPKINDVKFDPYYPGVYVTVGIPKYPESHPHFTAEDKEQLLTTYMAYANMSYEEIMAWYRENSRPVTSNEQSNS